MCVIPAAAVGPVPVFVRVYGLTPGASYRFRVVANGQGGVGYGSDEAFTTLPPFSEGLSARAAASGTAAAQASAARSMATLLAKQLARYGRTARIGRLLKKGSFRALFRAPAAGRVS